MDPRFFQLIYGPRVSRLGHKSSRKISVRNLQYGPRTRLVRGIYFFLSARAGGILQILRSDWFRERAVFSHPARSQRAVSDA